MQGHSCCRCCFAARSSTTAALTTFATAATSTCTTSASTRTSTNTSPTRKPFTKEGRTTGQCLLDRDDGAIADATDSTTSAAKSSPDRRTICAPQAHAVRQRQ